MIAIVLDRAMREAAMIATSVNRNGQLAEVNPAAAEEVDRMASYLRGEQPVSQEVAAIMAHGVAIHALGRLTASTGRERVAIQDVCRVVALLEVRHTV